MLQGLAEWSCPGMSESDVQNAMDFFKGLEEEVAIIVRVVAHLRQHLEARVRTR